MQPRTEQQSTIKAKNARATITQTPAAQTKLAKRKQSPLEAAKRQQKDNKKEAKKRVFRIELFVVECFCCCFVVVIKWTAKLACSKCKIVQWLTQNTTNYKRTSELRSARELSFNWVAQLSDRKLSATCAGCELEIASLRAFLSRLRRRRQICKRANIGQF